MKKIIVLAALLLGAAPTLTACGNGGDDSHGGSGSAGSAADFNDADVTFAKRMIPHHRQAVQMARMAKTHAGGREVRRLAEDIETAQAPEIETMRGWLADWGKNESPGPMGHDDHGMGGMGDRGDRDTGEMPGMMNDDDMRGLGTAHGATWDRMFLTMMIGHHRGAIDMAQTEQEKGQNPDATDLARRIETTQRVEIGKMRQMLRP